MTVKKKEKYRKKSLSGWDTKKIGIVLVGVFFAVAMVLSLMPMSVFSTFKTADAGNIVIVDYTLRDDRNQPVATSNQNIYNTVLQQGGIILLTDYLRVPVNLSTEKEITTIPVRNEGYQGAPFGILATEWNAISSGVMGMRESGSKTVSVEENPGLILTMDREKFENLGLNFTRASIGMEIPVVVTVQSYENILNNTTPQDFALRLGYVSDKTTNEISLNHAYTRIDLRLVRIDRS
ncbi:MAG TPA: hypothetical protein VMW63_11135 [Methanoregulaceae archaeon]|nr:hypothetical protein [Methanoregulaceae archaeon]